MLLPPVAGLPALPGSRGLAWAVCCCCCACGWCECWGAERSTGIVDVDVGVDIDIGIVLDAARVGRTARDAVCDDAGLPRASTTVRVLTVGTATAL